MKLIYIGNKLSEHGYTPTTIETLGQRLKPIINVMSVSNHRNYAFRILDMWKAILIAPKDSIVLIDTYSSKAFHFAWTCGVMAKWRGIPYIPFLHGGDLPQRMNSSKFLCSYYFENASNIVSPSGYLMLEVEKRFSVSVKIIPNFIDLDHYPVQPKKYDQIKLLWVRSFHKIYNPKMAVQVLKSLHDRGYDNAKLCMVGPDKDGSIETVETFAKELDIVHALELTGKLNKEAWIEKSKGFNIFINTTNADNTPVSVMEAMALGFPVVTTNVGGIPFLFENNKEGIMVPPNNTEAMTEAIINLLEKPGLANKLSLAAREKATSWDWLNVKKMWKHLFNDYVA
jgi:glycosyltransferase involved in cell wall biosynthesis